MTGSPLSQLQQAYVRIDEARQRAEDSARRHREEGRGGKAQVAQLVARGLEEALQELLAVDEGADVGLEPPLPDASYAPETSALR